MAFLFGERLGLSPKTRREMAGTGLRMSGINPMSLIDPTGLVDVDVMLQGKKQIDQGKVLQIVVLR